MKIKHRKLIIIIVAALLLSLFSFVGCEGMIDNAQEIPPIDANDSNRIEVLSIDTYCYSDRNYSTDYIVICDKQTGVCYLVVRSRVYGGKQVSIIMLVDSNGDPFIKE